MPLASAKPRFEARSVLVFPCNMGLVVSSLKPLLSSVQLQGTVRTAGDMSISMISPVSSRCCEMWLSLSESAGGQRCGHAPARESVFLSEEW